MVLDLASDSMPNIKTPLSEIIDEVTDAKTLDAKLLHISKLQVSPSSVQYLDIWFLSTAKPGLEQYRKLAYLANSKDFQCCLSS